MHRNGVQCPFKPLDGSVKQVEQQQPVRKTLAQARETAFLLCPCPVVIVGSSLTKVTGHLVVLILFFRRHCQISSNATLENIQSCACISITRSIPLPVWLQNSVCNCKQRKANSKALLVSKHRIPTMHCSL